MLVAPVLSRMYLPEDFGILGVFVSVSVLLSAGCAGRYEVSISLPADDDDGLGLLAIVGALTLTSAAVVGAVVWLAGAWLAELPRCAALAPYLWLLPISMASTTACQGLTQWGVRRMNYGRIARAKLFQGLGSAGTSLGVGVLHDGPLGLLLGSIASYALGMTQLAADALRVVNRRIPRRPWLRLWRLAVQYRQFPLCSAPAALLNALGTVGPPILLAWEYGPIPAGLFTMAFRVMTQPMSLLGTSVSQVFLGEGAAMARERPRELLSFFRRSTLHLLKVSGVVVAIGAVSPFVFAPIFGAKWEVAGLYAALLSVGCAAQVVVSPLGTVPVIVKRQDVQLVLDAVRAILVAAALILPGRLGGHDATVAVGLYSAAMCLVYGITYIACHRMLVGLVRRAEAGIPEA